MLGMVVKKGLIKPIFYTCLYSQKTYDVIGFQVRTRALRALRISSRVDRCHFFNHDLLEWHVGHRSRRHLQLHGEQNSQILIRKFNNSQNPGKLTTILMKRAKVFLLPSTDWTFWFSILLNPICENCANYSNNGNTDSSGLNDIISVSLFDKNRNSGWSTLLPIVAIGC